MDDFNMQDVINAVKRDFPAEDYKRVTEHLNELGQSLTEREKVCLWMGVIYLSERDTKKLIYWVEEAKIDPKKIIHLS